MDYYVAINGFPACERREDYHAEREVMAREQFHLRCGYQTSAEAFRARDLYRQVYPTASVEVVEGVCPTYTKTDEME